MHLSNHGASFQHYTPIIVWPLVDALESFSMHYIVFSFGGNHEGSLEQECFVFLTFSKLSAQTHY